MSDRAVLLKRVQVCDFVLNDTALYLDTHPTDKKALDYYRKYQAMRQDALRQFTEKYGPLSRNDFDGQSWNWVDGPWPWQTEENA